MKVFLAVLKAIFTRLVFSSHGLIAVWQATTFKRNPNYWYLCCPIICLFFEGIFTLTIKENQEWKWFCPSVFLYLCSTVPSIWLLELDKINRKMKARESSNLNITDSFDLTHLAAEDLRHLQNTLGVNIKLPDLQISAETWVTLIEQFLMLILIIGRWMLPKGDLTRDQLSQLLLVYIGTAADIIEFFDSFKEERVSREPLLVYLTLGIWTWSLLQFTVVLTATKSRKSRLSANTIKRKTKQDGEADGCCTIDVWGIALNMILQDGPFLAFRLILIIEYKIVNYMNIFFTCKNTLVILLQLYRLYVVQSETKSKRTVRRLKQELPSISIISMDEVYGNKKYSRGRESRIKETKIQKEKKEKKIFQISSFSEDEDDSKSEESVELVKHKKYKHRRPDGECSTGSISSPKHQKVKSNSRNKRTNKNSRDKSKHRNDSFIEEEKIGRKKKDKHSETRNHKKSSKKVSEREKTETESSESDSSESISEICDRRMDEKIRRKNRMRNQDRQ